MMTEAYEKWWEMNDALIGYEEYVKRLGVYQDRQVPFVGFWVKWFLESGLPDDESFSSLPGASGKQDWQIRQALDAVRLFRSFSDEACEALLFEYGGDLFDLCIRFPGGTSMGHPARVSF